MDKIWYSGRSLSDDVREIVRTICNELYSLSHTEQFAVTVKNIVACIEEGKNEYERTRYMPKVKPTPVD